MKNSTIIARLNEMSEEIGELRSMFRRNLDEFTPDQLQEIYDAADALESLARSTETWGTMLRKVIGA